MSSRKKKINVKKKFNIVKKNLLKIIKDKKKEIKSDSALKDKIEVDNMSTKKKKRKTTKKTNNKKKKRSIGKKLLTALLVIAIIIAALIVALFGYIVISSSTFDPNALANQDQTIVYDKNGETIAALGSERRESVTYDQLPQVLVDAIIATEDSRFFQHNGLDVARFAKASFGQILGNSDAGGASTLTMQVVKNNLTSTDRSIIRKFKDIYLSVFFMEKKYSKEQILEFYVNDSLLGGNVYGVGQAAEYYFNKSVSELTLPEAALIAGLFQSPNGYNPYYYPEAAAKRRNTVLKLMVKHGYITQEEANMANETDVTSLLNGSSEKNAYQGYIDTVVDEVIKKTGDDPYLVSMKIYTNMEKDIQDGINSALNGETYTWENDKVQAGITVVNVETGAISAIGAGRNRQGERTYNYATMAVRQPGSTSKPLFDYGPGFEYNNYSTYTLFTDEAWAYSDGTKIGNWDGGYKGLMTLKEALSISRNITALKAFQEVSKPNIKKFVTSLGITPEENLHEAHSIGGFTGVTTVDMAGAYAGFASGGYFVEPYTVSKIVYRSDDTTKEFKPKKERVMKDSTAYLMNNALEYAVTNGFNGGARVYGSHVAAKTGTSNFDEATFRKYKLPGSAVNDLWTVAYTSEYSIALWYGYEHVSSEYYNTSGSPKDRLMSAVMKNIPKDTKGWSMPSSVVASQVERGTWPAQLPSEYTPSDLIITEYFKKGTQPTEVSERYSKLKNVTNMNTKVSGSSITLTWNYDIPKINTESYLKDYFSQSVFGKSTSHFLQERLNYNRNTLGELGFGIYEKNSSGTLTRRGFTTKNTYTYNVTSTNTKAIIIKTEYNNFKSNASDGVEVKINASVVPTNTLSALVNSDYSLSVSYNGKDVTEDSIIEYKIVEKNRTFDTYSAFKTYIDNDLPSGNYTLSYSIEYEGQNIIKNKDINK